MQPGSSEETGSLGGREGRKGTSKIGEPDVPAPTQCDGGHQPEKPTQSETDRPGQPANRAHRQSYEEADRRRRSLMISTTMGMTDKITTISTTTCTREPISGMA